MRPPLRRPYPCRGALAVKMGCRLVRAEILKYRAQAVAAADFLSGDRVSTVHVDNGRLVTELEWESVCQVDLACL
jgi:hypothetical protein